MSTITYIVAAVKPRAWFVPASWLIRIFQFKKYSHYIISVPKLNETIDSSLAGTKWNNTEKMLKKYEIVKSWKFEISNSPDIKEWSKKYEGNNYSVLQNIGSGLKFLGILKRNPFGNNEKSLNCSELSVLWCRDFLQAQIIDPDEYDLVSAEELLDLCKQKTVNSIFYHKSAS